MDIKNFIDNSLLKPDSTAKEVEEFVSRSEEIGFYAVCIPPCYVRLAREVRTGKIKICSVVGFPLGYSDKGTKIKEASGLIEEGADEIDVVINISALKSGKLRYVEEEVKSIVRLARGSNTLTKFILETCYLTDEEKIRASRMVRDCGGDFVKTSTGFGKEGARLEDVRLIKEKVEGIKVKASGGIRTLEEVLAFIEAGADRIGTSRGFEIYSQLNKG